MKKAGLIGVLLVFAAIMLRPETAIRGAQRAMHMWYASVAPSLFPFLALMPMLTSAEACAAYESMFAGLMRPVFSLPGSAAPAVIMAMICGSPGGALAVRRVAGSTGMRRGDALRLAYVFGGVGPSFLIMVVGQGMLGSVSLGLRLAGLQIAVQLFLLAVLRNTFKDEKIIEEKGTFQEQSGVRFAVESLLVICGYMVLFGITASIASCFIGREAAVILQLLMDLPSGLAELAQNMIPARMLILGMAIGFGGLCIAAQNMNVLKTMGATWKGYVGVRCMSTGLMGCLSSIFLTGHKAVVGNNMQNMRKLYVVALLAAVFILIPTLIFFSKNIFLNKRKIEEKFI